MWANRIDHLVAMSIFAVPGSCLVYFIYHGQGGISEYLGLAICAAIIYSFVSDLIGLRIRIFPFYDKPLKGGTFLHGHALARNFVRLEDLARAKNLPPVSRFGFADPLRGEERTWWKAEEGLVSVRGLLKAVRAAPYLMDDPAHVCADLERIERALVLAHASETRFALLVKSSTCGSSLSWERRGGYP